MTKPNPLLPHYPRDFLSWDDPSNNESSYSMSSVWRKLSGAVSRMPTYLWCW
jgi:hypothetical protein